MIRAFRLAAAAASIIVFATACGGAHSAALPSTSLAPQSAQHGSVTLTITVPPKQTASARRPAYISPATQSIAVSFTPAAGGTAQTFNQNLTTGSQGCTASLVSPLICTVTISLAAGSYIASFTTYDGLLDGNGVPQGNVLSQNQNFGITIVAGQNNAINAVLQGVPSSVMISALGGTAAILGQNTFLLDKCFTTQQFSVLALDADGNVIVGPGAPVVSLSTTSSLFTIAGPTNANPNDFTITRTGLPVGLSTAQATARFVSGAGGPAASTTTLYLSFNASNCGVDTTIGSGFNAPLGVAADSNGNVYVADTGNNAIKEISPSGTTSTYRSSITSPNAVTVDYANRVFVVENFFSVLQVTASSQTTVSSAFSFATSLAAAPSNQTLYVADNAANKIDLVNIASGSTARTINGFSFLAGVTVDANGNLYVADENNGLSKIESDGTAIQLGGGDPHIVQPASIAVDPSGTVYYTDLALGIVGKLSASGFVTQFAGGLSEPSSIFIAGNGDIYVADTNNGTGVIHRYR